MKKFLIKILIIMTITVIIILTRIITLNFNNFKKYSFRFMPLNHISNSQNFNAKIDNLVSSANFKCCTFLIAGSSMSLNNISGNIISKRTKDCVYNISSWGFKIKQLNQFLKIIDIDSIKYLLVAFNNWDFGKLEFEIDFKAADSYINGNKITRYMSFINNFNATTFSKDWNNRYKFSNINNTYGSLNFDEYGSILFDQVGFIIDQNRWNAYKDTTGFNYFYNDINDLDYICKQHKITLILVYLPSRPNLLTYKNIIQNQSISKVLKNKFDKSFLDMQNVKIPSNQYCDGTHLFKDGAESITNSIIDSLNKNNRITLPK